MELLRCRIHALEPRRAGDRVNGRGVLVLGNDPEVDLQSQVSR